jgi:REP element-mobilizing transposase RayT
MARPLRIERVGGWYHLTARGNERRAIYRDDRDRLHFCELLAEMVSRFGVRLHAYVLMDNHYHLLLELLEPNLSRAAQWLNVSYSVWFNRRHARSGHLFQGRFKSIVVNPVEWGLALSRYVHLNPVRVGRLGLGKAERGRARAGLSPAPKPEQVRERIQQLRRYRWSSYRAYLGMAREPEWLECGEVLRLGGGKKGEERRAYREDVEGAVREGLFKSPWEELKEQVVLGGAEFMRQIRSPVSGDEREQRRAKRLAVERPGLEAVIGCVEKIKGEKWETFRDRHGDSGRDMVLYLGRRACGMKLRELAEAVGMVDYAVVAMGVKRYEARLKQFAAERKQLTQVAQLLNFKM